MSDLDNLAKPVLDVMTEVGVWEDDRHVIHLELYKYKANSTYEEQEGVHVEVYTA